jgi:hypothetical protein
VLDQRVDELIAEAAKKTDLPSSKDREGRESSRFAALARIREIRCSRARTSRVQAARGSDAGRATR